MMKIKNLFVIMLVMALGAITACNDDTATKETPQQVKERQLSKTWDITQYTHGTTVVNEVATTITFNDNGQFTITQPAELPNTFSPDESLPSGGTWAFANTTSFNTITLTPTSGTPVTLNNVIIADNSLSFDYDAMVAKNQTSVTVTAVPQ